MKNKKVVCGSLLSFVMMFLLSLSVLAGGYSFTGTTYYGTLKGRMSQSGVYLNTVTSVTQNQYGGYLHTIVQVTDAYDTVISNSHFVSSAGELSMSRTLQMVTIIRTVAYPNAAFATHEVRGGSQVGNCVYTDIAIDPTPFY